VVGATVAVMILTWIPLKRIGSEFMPPLNEGSLLYMPTTLPGISVQTALDALRKQDSVLVSFPEVKTVFGKAGRAGTATDPAPLSMFETTITLAPEEEWRPGMTMERLIAELDSAVTFPGITNSWTMPIKGRIDMLATGIRTPVGVKIFGEDLAELERLGREVEAAVAMVPGTRSAFAERVVSGSYLDIQIDRDAAARYGLSVGDIQRVIASAIGGMSITEAVEGRERYGVRVRYPQELRDQPEKLAEVLIPLPARRPAPPGSSPSWGSGSVEADARTPGSGRMADAMMSGGQRGGAQIPLGQVASISTVRGPVGIKTEGAFPTAWVYIDVADRDLGSYVADAQAMVRQMVTLPPGYRLEWSGQYAFMQRAQARLRVVVPATLLIIFVLLYLTFGRIAESLIVMLCLPFSLVGGVLLLWLLGFNWSVATGVGFIALAGVTAETGVIMLLYLDQAWTARRQANGVSARDLYEAIVEGAVLRLRPKMMTVTTVVVGLLPIFWGHGAGSTVMRRIAAPMVGGMVSATVLTLVVIPVVYSLWQEWAVVRPARDASLPEAAPAPMGAD
jgi:Cu(I)/Ag(I) efflux system membrane protein CusA/SilA